MPAPESVGEAEVLRLRAEPLTQAAFAPFGDVIEPAAARRHYPINAGSAERFHDVVRIDTGAADGHTVLSLVLGQPVTLPARLRLLERHPLGSQSWLPLDGGRFLIVVAPAGEQWTLADVRAFVSDGRQGVNYARGVWHHPLLSLGEAPSMYVVVDRDGPGDNCEERPLPRVVELVV